MRNTCNDYYDSNSDDLSAYNAEAKRKKEVDALILRIEEDESRKRISLIQVFTKREIDWLSEEIEKVQEHIDSLKEKRAMLFSNFKTE